MVKRYTCSLLEGAEIFGSQLNLGLGLLGWADRVATSPRGKNKEKLLVIGSNKVHTNSRGKALLVCYLPSILENGF